MTLKISHFLMIFYPTVLSMGVYQMINRCFDRGHEDLWIEGRRWMINFTDIEAPGWQHSLI